MKRVSIVINTLDRAHQLAITLKSLRYLKYNNFEVIVVNGPSIDETPKVLSKYKDIKVAYCSEKNLSKSRNIGVAMSCGEYIAFIDDDAIPEPEWLQQIMEGFDNEDVAAVGGRVYDKDGYNFQYTYSNADRLGNNKKNLKRAYPEFCFPFSYEFPYLQGTNMCFRKSALIEIGGFDEEYTYYLDETDVFVRLIDHGYVVRQLENAYVHHKHIPSYIRPEGRANFIYPILKSKIYFSNKHAKLYHTKSEICYDEYMFIEKHRHYTLQNINNKRYTKNDFISFEKQAYIAKKIGEYRSSLPKKTTITSNNINVLFRRFSSVPNTNNFCIVYLCDSFSSGSLKGFIRYTNNLAMSLVALGVRIHIVTCGKTKNTVDFEDGVWVHRVVVKHQTPPQYFKKSKISQSDWDVSKTLLDEIDRINQSHKIDIVESPVSNALGFATCLSNRYVVLTRLDSASDNIIKEQQREGRVVIQKHAKQLFVMEKHLLESCNGVIATSKNTANKIIKKYNIDINQDKIFLNTIGLQDASEKFSSYTSRSKNKLDIFIFYNSRDAKAINTIFEVASKVLKRYNNIVFNVVDNSEKDLKIEIERGLSIRDEDFSNSLKEYINSGSINFYENLNKYSLNNLYSICDIFVDLSGPETFGINCVDAMAFQKPCVCYDCYDLSEIVLNGQTGIVISHNDLRSLYQAIKKLIDEPNTRENMGKAGRERYLKNYTDKLMKETMLKIYYKFLS